MKIGLNVGDKVKVLVGKFAGKEDVVTFIDKRTKRVRLEKLKKLKTKGKGGKELHGTFHLTSLSVLKPQNQDASAAEGTEQKAG